MRTIFYRGEPLHDPMLDIFVTGIKCSMLDSSAGSLEFDMPPNHPLYGKLAKMDASREIVLADEEEELFRGRVTDDSDSIDGMRHVTCEGQLAYINDSRVRPYGTYADVPGNDEAPQWTTIAPNNRHDYAEWLITQHNAQTDAAKQYRIGVNDLPDKPIRRSSTTKPTTKQEIDDKLIDPFGCSIIACMHNGVRYVDFRADGGRDATQKIEFGENLLEFAHASSARDAVTCIIPTAKPSEGDGFGLEGHPDGPVGDGMTKQGDRILLEAGVTLYGIIEDAREYEVDTVQGLIDACCSDLASQNLTVDTVDITALDLHQIDPTIERIRLGEWVTVSALPLKFEASMLCVRIDYSVDSGGDRYVLGAEYDSLTNGGTAAKMRRYESSLIERMEPISSEAKAAAKKADVAVISSTDEYAVSEYPASAPAEGWSADQPAWEQGRYIWRRAVTAKGDGTTEVGAPALMTGNSGEDATLVRVDSSRGLVFKNNAIATVLIAVIFHGATRIEDIETLRSVYGATAYIEWSWQRIGDESFSTISIEDSRIGNDGFTFTITSADVDTKTVFQATVRN